jgi:hypothetical protein
LAVIEIENSEPLSERLSEWTVDPDILALAEEVNTTGFPSLGAFHAYEEEDESS